MSSAIYSKSELEKIFLEVSSRREQITTINDGPISSFEDFVNIAGSLAGDEESFSQKLGLKTLIDLNSFDTVKTIPEPK